MDFYTMAGQMALGSRLRRLADTLMHDAQQLYQLYGVDIDTRWFPVFYVLMHKQNAAINELAQDIGQSHPAVSQVVQEMLKSGVVDTNKCSKDARVSRVSLTAKGRDIAENLSPQCEDVNSAVENLLNSAGSNLWSELEAVEYELQQIGLYDRVVHVRKQRESHRVEIIPYVRAHKDAFKSLNEAWIEKHFTLEAEDRKALDNPEKSIIKQGGYIAIATLEGAAIGTCALIKMDDDTFELAKMAVAESAKGMGIGFLLGEHMLEHARDGGAQRVYLESNTALLPALNLYRKLGFKRIKGPPSPYERCNIQMELVFGSKS